MSFPQSKPLVSGFSNDNEICNRAVGKMRPLRRAGPPIVKCRPATASRSLKSISNSRNAVSSKAAGKDHMLNDALTANLLSREELVEALFETKKRLVVLDSNTAYLRAENQRCENDIAKQHRRIEKLLDSTSASPNINCSSSKIYHGSSAPSGDARRELEKSLLVRQLKSQIMILRGAVAEREIEIETLKRSQKGSKIAELLNEKEEYFLETVRLKQAATELRDALQYEKLQNSWNMKRNGARNEVCRELSGVTSVYRSTMKGVVQSSDSKTRTTKSRIVTTINSNQTNSKRCMKAGSRSVVGETRQFHSSGALKPLGQLPHSTSSFSLDEDESNAWHQSIKDYTVRDELDYFSGLGGSSTGTGQHFTEDNLRHDAYDDMAFELTDGTDLHNGISSEIINDTQVVSVFITGIQYDNHYLGEQQFINGINILLSFESLWNCEVSTLIDGKNSASLAFFKSDERHSDMSWHATLRDLQIGHLNVLVLSRESPSITHPIGDGKQKIAFYPNFKELAAPDGARSDMMLAILIRGKNGSDVGRVSISLNVLTQAAPSDETTFPHRDSVFPSSATPTFKVGDVFEGQYIGGMDWYKATVKAVNAPCSSNSSSSAIGLITYQVLYDDGDVENEIEEARMRHLISTPGTPNATLGIPHTLQALYAIGDPVEALYGRGIDWYAASVTAVTTAGKYNLLYDDGDVEDDVSLARMRAQPSTASRQTAAATSPCSTSAFQLDTSMCLCGRELVLGFCADCNAHIAPKGAPVALTEGKEGDCDILQIDLKSSKDAFFDNYLDELSDDDGPDPHTGTAAYGDLGTLNDDTILKIANPGDCKVSMEEALIHDLQTEGGYEEDFDT